VRRIRYSFYRLKYVSWSFLSRKGTITIFARSVWPYFFFRPQLNPGQFRNDLSIIHTITRAVTSADFWCHQPFRRIGSWRTGVGRGPALFLSRLSQSHVFSLRIRECIKNKRFYFHRMQAWVSVRAVFLTRGEAGENLWHEKLVYMGYSLFDTSFHRTAMVQRYKNCEM